MTALQNNFLRFSHHTVPSALKRFWGSRLHGTFALLFDEISDGVRQAVRLRVVQEDTPTDSLPFLARQFSVPWFGTETEADYRLALRASDGTVGAPGSIGDADSGEAAGGVWRRAVERGSPKSVEEALLRAGLVGVVEIANGPDGYDPGVPPFFRYRIRLTAYDVEDCEPWLYGEAPPYGGGWYYGTKLPAAVVKAVLNVHKFYAPARSRLDALVCGPVPGFDDFATLFSGGGYAETT